MTSTTEPKRILTREDKLLRLYESEAYSADLSHLRYQERYVKGRGNARPKLLIVRPTPTMEDAAVGAAIYQERHSIYLELLRSVGLEASSCYFTTMLKYRPYRGRDPRLSELVAGKECLDQEIAILKPDAIVMLGMPVVNFLVPNMKMYQARGRVHEYNGRKMVVSFDPEIVRVNRTTVPLLMQDFSVIQTLL